MPRSHPYEHSCQLCPEPATRAIGSIRIGELCFGRLIDICADAGVTISPDDYRPSNRTNGSKPMSVNIDETEELTGAQIKVLREKHGWGEIELAKRAGISAQNVRRYEAGERSPKARVRARLLKAFAGETEPPAQLTTRAPRKATRAASAPPHQRPAPVAKAPTNGKHAAGDTFIVLRTIDFDVTGDGSDEDAGRLEHALSALESLWRLTGAKVEIELPPGRHRITPRVASVVLGQT